MSSSHEPRAKTACAAFGGGADRLPSPLAASEMLFGFVPTDIYVSAMSWHQSVSDVLTCSQGHGHDHGHDYAHDYAHDYDYG